ncbi:MAG: helicase-associated domain-containing protein, partial [Treponema sp.]|nr:helicase-associated domain-containing protein [Treponema sp.]
MQFDNPLIVQTDRTILLDVHAPKAKECRDALIPFAELERSPEHIHTYRLTPLSLWNASSAGFTPKDAIKVLNDYARYDVPQAVTVWIEETAGRFGKIRLVTAPYIMVPKNLENPDGEKVKEEYLYLITDSLAVYKEIAALPVGKKYLTETEYIEPQEKEQTVVTEDEKKYCFSLHLTDRGIIKQELLKCGWPVKDDVVLRDGEPLEVSFRDTTKSGKKLIIRDYQKEAAKSI